MKKLLSLLLPLMCLTSYCQDFEGTVDYRFRYIVKPETAIDTTYLRQEFGTVSQFTSKAGKIKQVTNCSMMGLQLYLPQEKRLYFTDGKSPDELLYYQTNGFENTDFKIEIVKDAATIAGYKCDKLIYKNEKSHAEFYYAPELKFSPKHFNEFYLADKNEIIKIMKAIYLRADYIYTDFTAIMEATKVTRMKVADSEFAKPAHKVVRQQKL